MQIQSKSKFPPSLGLSGESFKDNPSTYLKYLMWLLLPKMHGINEFMSFPSFRTSLERFLFACSCVINTFVCLFFCHKYSVSASH